MATEVRVLGCGDAFASGGHLHACFYLKNEDTGVLVDCGATVLTSLKRYNVSLDDIDTILISHFHGDHYGGLPYFLLESGVRKRIKPLTIVTPPGGEQRVMELLELLYPETDAWKALDLRFDHYAEDTLPLDIPGARVMAYPVVHSAASKPHGLRIEIGGKIVGYSGDTGWTPTLGEIAQHADLFICECNFYDLKLDGHLDYLTLLEHDGLLSYRRILLTHLGEGMLARLDELRHPYAREGMEVVL